MNPIRKISDLPRIETLLNENQILLRRYEDKTLWTGSHVEDILPYKQKIPFVDPKVFVKRIDDRLRSHLDSEFPHYCENRDLSTQEAYKFNIESDDVIEFITKENKDEFNFDASKNFLNFLSMFKKHIEEDSDYHKIYDERTSSWKYYKINLEYDEEPIFSLELVDSTDNTEIFQTYENQQSDYGFYEELFEEHVESLMPHKLINENKDFSIVISNEEIMIEWE